MSGFTVNTVVPKPKIPEGIAFSGLSSQEQTGRCADMGCTSGLALSVLRRGALLGHLEAKLGSRVWKLFP